ncbi:uncharacterized protein [Prorops nasuta]|uniref:uncharacterized protein n=1 Tax=Prorops nasuta TaxID=863751 RepID=UPI0034D020CF
MGSSKMANLYKVWTFDRKRKISLLIEDCFNLIENVIAKANTKLGIMGTSLVLEEDGTIIDDDEVLKFCRKSAVFMLLEDHDKWSPACDAKDTDKNVSSSCIPTDSTSTSAPSNLLTISDKDSRTNVTKYLNSEEFWDHFEINWSNIDPTVLKELEDGRRNIYVIYEVVNRTVAEMKNEMKIITSKAFKIMSRKIVNKYPKTFKDFDEEGKTFGDGTYTTYRKLHDRYNYLNMPHMKRSLPRTENVPISKQRKVLSARAGCKNWQPKREEEDPDDLDISSEAKVAYLRSCVSNIDNTNKEMILDYLNATYSEQRLYLNIIDNPHSVVDIQKEWPILLKKQFLFWHYEKLMGHSIHLLKEKISTKQQIILEYGIKKNLLFYNLRRKIRKTVIFLSM